MGRWTVGRILALAAAVGTVAFWFYLFVVADPDTPDELDDPGFAAAAQPRCAEAQEAIDDLPDAATAGSPEERGEAVATANVELASMVADLAEIPTANDHDAELVAAWLEDWDAYLGDREVLVEQLAAGEDAELLVTARGGRQITLTMDNFAVQNDMDGCRVPLDV